MHTAISEESQKNKFSSKTARQQHISTKNRLPLIHDRIIPSINAMIPYIGLEVASTIAGKVISASVI